MNYLDHLDEVHDVGPGRAGPARGPLVIVQIGGGQDGAWIAISPHHP